MEGEALRRPNECTNPLSTQEGLAGPHPPFVAAIFRGAGFLLFR
jgi:hypothetical protein